MACKPRPCPAQQTSFANRSMAVQNDALAKTDSDGVAMHPNPVTGLNFYPAIQFNMRVKMSRALFDFDAAWRIECFGRQESGHDFGAFNISAKLLV